MATTKKTPKDIHIEQLKSEIADLNRQLEERDGAFYDKRAAQLDAERGKERALFLKFAESVTSAAPSVLEAQRRAFDAREVESLARALSSLGTASGIPAIEAVKRELTSELSTWAKRVAAARVAPSPESKS